jgi:GTP-binding protein HflX
MLAELTSLLAGLGVLVVRTVTQKHAPLDSPHVLGKGKLEELRLLVTEALAEADEELIVAVAADITPGEQRSLERALGVPVIDRTGIILRVFQARAQTRLARLEVELAQRIYDLPRVRDDQSLGDREGGGGRGGRGHSNVELTKQRLRKEIAEVRQRIGEEQAVQRQQRRRRSDVPHAALVGYTNAGKSCLMRALTGSDVLVEDRLFATLGTTVRAMQGTAPRVLLSDTVGFVRELPHQLVQSFCSTLETSLEAGLLLHVVDASDEEMETQLRVTRDVLAEIGGGDIPSLLVLSKIDRVDAERRAQLREASPDALSVNAFDEADVERVRSAIARFFEQQMVEATFEVPFSDGRRLAELRSSARILEERHSETGMVITLRAAPGTLSKLRAG